MLFSISALKQQTLDSCLSISIGDGLVGSSASPQAAFETDQSVVSSQLQIPRDGKSNGHVGVRNESPTGGMSDMQLINDGSIGQFNYNPLYMSSHDAHHHHHISESCSDKNGNLAQTNQDLVNGSSQLNEGGEDMLDDIYQCRQQKQDQDHFDQPDQQNRDQSSSSSSSILSANHPGDLYDGANTDQRNRAKHQAYSGANLPSFIERNTDTFNEIHHSMLIGGSGRPNARRNNLKNTSDLDRKRLSALNNSVQFNQQPQAQQQQFNFQQQQQHQFMVASTSSHPMELAEECNGGLFVEYQTNRNHLGGLEELHSLNVTNCDSETLEEQINMLSGEDCFTSGDDLQDFAIGSTNDHFLNMLTLGAAGVSGVGMSSQSIGSQLDCISGSLNQTFSGQQHTSVDQMPAASRSMNERIDVDLRQHFTLPDVIAPQTTLMDKRVIATGKNKQKDPSIKATTQQNCSKRSKTRKRAAETSSDSSSLIFSQDDEFSSISTDTDTAQVDTTAAAALQDKITTTNTNKRLLPTKKNNTSSSVKSREQAIKKKSNSSSSWMSSPNSSSVSTNSSFSGLSPSSSSQLEIAETPYRQHLENLKKKLKMDAPPLSAPSGDQTERKTDEQNNLAQHQGYLRTSMNPTSGSVHQSDGASGALIVNNHDATNFMLSTANLPSRQLQQHNHHQEQQQSCATTYVIARQIEQPQGFEAAPGTIYLRTSNGSLVQLNSNRRSATVVQIGSQPDTDYSSQSSPVATNRSPMLISCVGSTRGSATNSYTNNDHQQQQQQYMSSPINSQGPTAGLIFHHNRHHHQQPSDETLISTIDLDANQTLLIPSNGPSADELDPTSSKHNHNNPHHHQNQAHQKHQIQSSSLGGPSTTSAASLMSQSLFGGPVTILQNTDQIVGQ